MDDITSEILTMLLHVIQSSGSIQGLCGSFWIFPSSVCDLEICVYVSSYYPPLHSLTIDR